MFADRGQEHKTAWCGIFALSCYMLEGLWPDPAPRWEPGVKHPEHKGRTYYGFAALAVDDGRMKITHEPEPGDLVIFGAPLWHHAIVERVEGGKVHSIDGNVLPFPKEGCAAKVRDLTPAVTFYSIHPLISGV